MSLFDYLNNATGTSSPSTQSELLLQQIAAQKGTAANATTTTTASSGNLQSVLITLEAQRANAEAGDAAKDSDKLVAQLRQALNASSGMGTFSGRALSIVALNETGTFSKEEAYAARAELRDRDRQAALTFLNSGDLTASSLKTYGQQLLAARAQMSAEEQQLRDSDPDLR